ncbi:hypothetical protein BEN47_01965 [Hymenobacter lapidarius]|uniref:Uncharacterized protein n=1 Tax=Hymenobacter lapidarius TaxID=1908237 RepID=A0A1G1T2K9_9BACT|nr:DUF6252 family protein [Hymenobacter lapidarius]OGX85123.1 hypothetical protein BEN47_01965 [Hymenobacter lapidarius]
MKNYIPVLLLPALLGLTQCIMQREGAYPVQPMPEATQTGANTAGCLVDGLPWVAHHSGTGIGALRAYALTAEWDNFSVGRPHLALSFAKYIDDQAQVHDATGVKLHLPGITRPGTFVLDQTPRPLVSSGPIGYAAFTFYKTNPNRELLTGPDAPGRVVVTRFDTLARVVSGTFEFTARQASGGTTVRVTEGRFDCKF